MNERFLGMFSVQKANLTDLFDIFIGTLVGKLIS
jgi:hypothetical protein